MSRELSLDRYLSPGTRPFTMGWEGLTDLSLAKTGL